MKKESQLFLEWFSEENKTKILKTHLICWCIFVQFWKHGWMASLMDDSWMHEVVGAINMFLWLSLVKNIGDNVWSCWELLGRFAGFFEILFFNGNLGIFKPVLEFLDLTLETWFFFNLQAPLTSKSSFNDRNLKSSRNFRKFSDFSRKKSRTPFNILPSISLRICLVWWWNFCICTTISWELV